MDIEFEISNLRTKTQAEKLVKWIGKDPEEFKELMNLFLCENEELSRRAAWIVGHCGEKHPDLAIPYLKEMIKMISKPNSHSAILRNVMRVLQYVKIPKSLKGEVVNICFEYLNDIKLPIAARVFAMTVLANIAKNDSYLMRELRIVVEQMIPYSTPAFHSRARRIFKDLRRTYTKLSKEQEDDLLNVWLMKK